MKKTILLAILAGTIKPRIIHAHDNVYRRDSLGMSSIDASLQASVEITSIATLEGTSQATSGRGGQLPRDRARYYKPISFLENNRDIIMEDISKGEGEHLTTLLKLMKLKRDSKSLSKIQMNFNTLLTLNSIDFLYKLEKLDNS